MSNLKLTCHEKFGPSLILNIRNKQYILCFCHHLSDRSIHFFGIERVLCARCFGVLIGFFIGLFLFFIGIRVPLVIALIMISPLIIDGFTQLFELRESNNFLRFSSGMLFINAIFLFE